MALFQTYPRIRESHGDLTPKQANALNAVTWIATEKIHGANFCMLTNGEHVECAKRKALLDEAEDFFGHRHVVSPLYAKMLSLWQEIAQWTDKSWGVRPQRLACYGELYGGGYAHPDVPVVDTVQRVQTGIDYAPSIHFCGFDLAVLCQEEDEEDRWRFLDFDVAQALATRHGIMWTLPLARGPLGKLLESSTVFDSTIPTRHGLPPLPSGSNGAEGLVLRPAQEQDWPSMTRPLIKLKNPRFAEDERYHQATHWSSQRAYGGHGNQALDRLEWEASRRMTPPRHQAALSKLGRPKNERDPLFDAVVEEMLLDVFAELHDAHAHDLLAIAQDDFALLQEMLREDARVLARASF